MPAPPLWPSSTYRLQFCSQFTLPQATELVDYLDALGIGACYASPLVKARAGSAHGYDIVDHSTINPELGGLDQLRRFGHQLREHGMGLILDVVPNHMSIAGTGNRWWNDVLENGPSSPFAHFFDIDWAPPKPELRNKILLPLLGEQYGRVLEDKELQLAYEAGAFWVHYQDLRLPLEPRSWMVILKPVLANVSASLGECDDRVLELASALTALHNLPVHTTTDSEQVKERHREKEIIKRRLAALTARSHEVRLAIATTLEQMNGTRGEPRSFDALESLLQDQAFRLSSWRVAADEINYRRFFDINDLAAIRVDEPSVFMAVHELLFWLLEQRLLTGLRIDHIDGIAEPRQYLERMVGLAGEKGMPLTPAGHGEHSGGAGYVLVEKILVGDEQLRADWPVAGTTGYEFLNLLNGLFVDASNQRAILDAYGRFTGSQASFDNILYESKQLVLAATMAGELRVLARRLDRIAAQHRWSRDFTLNSLQQALTEIIACFPVYRTYAGGGSAPAEATVSAEDRCLIGVAIRRARRKNPSTSATLFDFIGSVLLHKAPQGLDAEQLGERREFVRRFEQLTAPVMAKGLEDTAFYRYYPLASLNEVGGNPQVFGRSLPEFHTGCRERLARWPHALSTTSTHDTKRGEDVRARINVLSEMPARWEDAIERFRHLNQPHRRKLAEIEVPSGEEEYLLYQTLVGTWPDALSAPALAEYRERISAYMIKAVREAKVNTSWISPDDEYEQALRGFIDAILSPDSSNPFLSACAELCRDVRWAGMFNSLSQLLVKIAAPGVPDFFQGSELWELSLVDPDNRRPVDFAQRRAMLAALGGELAEDRAVGCLRLLNSAEDGRIKLYLTSRALAFRRAHDALFAEGAYEPIQAAGERQRHIIAFARSLGRRRVVAVAARLFTKLGVPTRLPVGEAVWGGTTLLLPEEAPAVRYRDVLSGLAVRTQADGTLAAREVFAVLPVALLVREQEDESGEPAVEA